MEHTPEDAVTIVVTEQITFETLTSAFAKAIAESTMSQPENDNPFHRCIIIFDHVLSSYERAQIAGGLLAYQLLQEDWLRLSVLHNEFVDPTSSDDGTMNTTYIFYVDLSLVSRAIHAAIG